MACLVHRGGYETLPDAYGDMHGWVIANGYRITGPNREIYLCCAGEDGTGSLPVTEVQCLIGDAE